MDTAEPGPEGELTDLERRLARWRPATVGLDRDRLLFEAGRASARGLARLISSLALMLVAAVLGVLLVGERNQRHFLEFRLAQMTNKAASPSPIEPTPPLIVGHPPAPDSYLALSLRLRTAGLDDISMPAPDATTGDAPPSPEPPLRVRGTGGSLNF